MKRWSCSPTQSSAPGDREEDRERARENGVQLLPRVEPTLWHPVSLKPAAVVAIERLDLAPGLGEASPVAEQDHECERDEPRDGRE